MATSVAQPATPSRSETIHPGLAWLQARQKPLSFALLAIALVLLVGWYLRESGRRKELQAAAALDQARAMVETGNYPEASSQLQRITQVYRGTDAAFEAVLVLNQVRMLSGQAQLAADELRSFITADPPAPYRAAAQSHLAMALENSGKFAEAAQAYLAAAQTAEAAYLKTDALLAAARSYRLSGDTAKAVETLEGIVKQFPAESPGVVEAKVRLAELTGGRA
jgi:TolA-binding protein